MLDNLQQALTIKMVFDILWTSKPWISFQSVVYFLIHFKFWTVFNDRNWHLIHKKPFGGVDQNSIMWSGSKVIFYSDGFHWILFEWVVSFLIHLQFWSNDENWFLIHSRWIKTHEMDFILCKPEKSGCQFGCIWFENDLNEI